MVVCLCESGTDYGLQTDLNRKHVINTVILSATSSRPIQFVAYGNVIGYGNPLKNKVSLSKNSCNTLGKLYFVHKRQVVYILTYHCNFISLCVWVVQKKKQKYKKRSACLRLCLLYHDLYATLDDVITPLSSDSVCAFRNRMVSRHDTLR